MKKLVILVTIGFAGLVSAKTADVAEKKVESVQKTEKTTLTYNVVKNAAEKAFQLCGVTVTYYNANGQYAGTGFYSSDQPTLTACLAWQGSKIRSLKLQGYSISLN